MKRRYIATISLMPVLMALALQAGERAKSDVRAGEPPQAPEQLDGFYSRAIDALMPSLADEVVSKRENSAGAIERMALQAGRPGAEAQRAACSQAMAARLGPEVAAAARVWLLRQLEFIGRAEAVPQVAKALADKDPLVREAARRALQRNPAKEASAALQEAVASAAEPAWRAALLNALAERSDPASLGLLLKEAAAENDDVRAAAVAALSKVGDKSAAPAIAAALTKGPPRARQLATDSYLLLADALTAKGDKAAALAIYKQMLATGGHTGCAALVGMGRAGGEAELTTLIDAAADDDARVRGASIEALKLFQGPEASAAISARLETAKPAAKAVLLQALALRGDQAAAATLAAIGKATEAAELPKLIDAAVNPKRPEQAASAATALKTAALQAIDRNGTIDKLLAATAKSPLERRVKVLEIVAAVGGPKALEAVAAAARDADPQLQDVGSRLLGEWRSPDAAGVLLDLAKTSGDAKFKVRALRGYIRIGRQFDVPAEQRIAMARQAMELAQRDEEKKLAVEVLGRALTKDGLAAAVALLPNPVVKAKAAEAVLAIGEKLLESEPAAVTAALKQVLAAGIEGDAADRAKALLAAAQAATPK